MNTSVIDNEERTPESQNSPKSPKTVVRVSHPPKMKQTGLILVKPETLDIFSKVFYISIKKKGESKADNYQKVSEKFKNYLIIAKNGDKGLPLLITHSKFIYIQIYILVRTH